MSYFRRAASVLEARSLLLWFSAVLGLVSLAIYTFYIVIVAFNRGTTFSGWAADGPFQLYNPLRRLAAGQVPGRDFPFFHGIGVPLIHYISFRLLGGNIFASEATRWIVSPGLFLATSFVFFLALFRCWRRSIIATAVATYVALQYVDVVYPTNSLIGVRTAVPMLTAAALLWRSKKRITVGPFGIYLRHLLTIVCLALSFLCGTEQGTAAICAYGVVRALELFRHTTKKQALLQLATEGGLIVVTTFIVMAVVTIGHPLAAIKYALVDIPGDQGWYFGTAPNVFLKRSNFLPEMTTMLMRYNMVIVLLAIAMIVVFWRAGMMTVRERNAYVFMLLYGAFTWTAIAGYFAPTIQFIPIVRGAILIIIGIAVSAFFSDRFWTYLTAHRLRITQYRRLGAIAAAVVIGVYVTQTLVDHAYVTYRTTAAYNVRATIHVARVARHSDDYFASNADWKNSLAAFAPYLKPHTSMWSTYASLYESQAHVVNPSKGGEDYIIHALGKERREAYLKQFVHDKPEYVVTLKPSYFPYEEWLWSRDWSLYAELMSNYTLMKENGSHYLWHINTKSLESPSTWTAVQKTASATYNLPANTTNRVKLYEVRVNYKAGTSLPVKSFDSLPRYLLTPHNNGLHYDISLPSYEQTWTFAVPVLVGQSNPRLDAKTDGFMPFAKLDIKSVEYRELGLTTPNDTLFRNNMCSQEQHRHDEVCQKDVTIPLNADEAAKPMSARVPD